MSLIKAIQRISWRFSSDKSFEPNEGDVKALNEIIVWVNQEKEERINDNRYFAKMAIYCYIKELEFYSDNGLAERRIQEVLEKPLEFWYSKFQEEMNRKELNDTLTVLGIEDPWSKTKMTLEKIQEDANSNKDLIREHQDKIQKAVLGTWNSSEIIKKLNFFITELLNKHGNKA